MAHFSTIPAHELCTSYLDINFELPSINSSSLVLVQAIHVPGMLCVDSNPFFTVYVNNDVS